MIQLALAISHSFAVTGPFWGYQRSRSNSAGVPVRRLFTLDGYDLTEDGVGLAFADKFRDRLRYCHQTGAWFVWDGIAWRQDQTKLAFAWARETCRAKGRETESGRERAALGRASFSVAVERFAQSDQRLVATRALWDASPFLLGTPGGTVDLRTGRLRPADPRDHITKLTAAAPAETEDCPRWLQFMGEVTANDPALIRFLQQWTGYCLTGDTREEALLFLYGPGGNGKGKFLNAFLGILRDYHRNADMTTFTASRSDRHPADLAHLAAARMVAASETNEGRAWDEQRIKQVTGNDMITYRFMNQNFFEYRPAFKLTIIGNHMPVISTVDNAFRRCFNIVPFNFKPAVRDELLEKKLEAEWPGILRWMINGCLDWQANGLVRPRVVKDATKDYFDDQDSLGQWMAERCQVGGAMDKALSSALFRDWKQWAEHHGEQPGINKALTGKLKRTFAKKREKTGEFFYGIKLLPSETGVV